MSVTVSAGPTTLEALLAAPPLHESAVSDGLRAVLRRHGFDGPPADLRSLDAPAACVCCLDGSLNLVLGDLAPVLRAVADRVEPGGLLAFDLDTASRHAWRLGETWVVEDPKTYICWEGKGADEADERVGRCDVFAFAEDGELWQRTDHEIRRRMWTHDEVLAAAATAGLEVLARHGQGPRGALHEACDDARHHQAVYVLRRPAQAGG